jgi:hypothetical protein
MGPAPDAGGERELLQRQGEPLLVDLALHLTDFATGRARLHQVANLGVEGNQLVDRLQREPPIAALHRELQADHVHRVGPNENQAPHQLIAGRLGRPNLVPQDDPVTHHIYSPRTRPSKRGAAH